MRHLIMTLLLIFGALCAFIEQATAASPTVDAGTNAKFAISNWSSAATFSSTANIFATTGANELAVVVLTYDGMASAGGGVNSLTISEGATTLTFTKYFKVQGPSSSFYQTIEVWTCQLPAQFNSGAATTTTAAVFSQAIDDATVGVFAVEGLSSITSPFDPNLSIPNGSVNTTNAPPPILTFSTSNPDDLLLFVSAQGAGPGGVGSPTSWTSVVTGINGGGARYQSFATSVKSVSSKQTSSTAQDPNTSSSTVSWSAIVSAFTSDSSSSPHPFFHSFPP